MKKDRMEKCEAMRKRIDWVCFLIVIICSFFVALAFWRNGFSWQIVAVSFFVSWGILAIVLALAHSSVIGCDNCSKRWTFIKLVTVETRCGDELVFTGVGFFCRACRKSGSWRRNPRFARYVEAREVKGWQCWQ